MTDAQVYVEAAVMGAVAGMRSMAAPAIVSQFAKSGLLPVEGSAVGFLRHPATVKTTAVLAIGEMVADKLPFMPKRTKGPAVVGRAITGGLSGAALASAKKRPGWAGALFGALGAIGATYGAYELRRWAGEKTHLPDAVIAIAEDAAVAACGYVILSALRAQAETA